MRLLCCAMIKGTETLQFPGTVVTYKIVHIVQVAAKLSYAGAHIIIGKIKQTG